MPTLIQRQIVLPFGRLDTACKDRRPLTLTDVARVFPAASKPEADPFEFADTTCEMLRTECDLQGSHEHLFLLLYFNRVIEKVKLGANLSKALLPLPNARLFMGTDSVKVDFAFWTGQKFIAVFIDESRLRQRKDEVRLLKAWGDDVYIMLADEFETGGLMNDVGLAILKAVGLR
jgi:hypothetical protein